MSFKALADRVFIRPDKKREKSDSGLIIIPDNARDPVTQGIVVYAGPGMLMKNGERWPMPVRPGDRVIYIDNSYPKVTIAGEELIMMRDDTILAVVENDR